MTPNAARVRVKRVHNLLHEHELVKRLIHSNEELSKMPNYDIDLSYVPNLKRRLKTIEEQFDLIFKK